MGIITHKTTRCPITMISIERVAAAIVYPKAPVAAAAMTDTIAVNAKTARNVNRNPRWVGVPLASASVPELPEWDAAFRFVCRA